MTPSAVACAIALVVANTGGEVTGEVVCAQGVKVTWRRAGEQLKAIARPCARRDGAPAWRVKFAGRGALAPDTADELTATLVRLAG